MKETMKNSLIAKTEEFLQDDMQEDMSYETAEENIGELRRVIQFHNYRYHSLADPIISDGEYDKLLELLQSWEEEHSSLIVDDTPSIAVGDLELDAFDKKEHRVPLLSLQNTYNADEIREWAEFLERQAKKNGDEELDTNEHFSYRVEAKLDGSSVEFIYEYGKLTGGITRGDGQVGEDISDHVRFLSNLPHRIDDWKDIAQVRLRGEVVMPESAFKKVNEYQEEEGLTIFANSRNATAGTLRQLKPTLVQARGLVTYCFEVLYSSNGFPEFEESDKLFAYLEEIGIPVFHWSELVDDIDGLIALCEDEEVQEYTQGGNVSCDGLVIKLNNLAQRELFGSTQHHPRWAIAYKYPTQEVSAHLVDISYQVGRTGVITPLAHVEPVDLGGVTISKATLHNFDFIEDRDIRIDDWIWLKRSGEVIPYVIGPITQRRTGDEKKVTIPEECPVCGGSIASVGEQVAYICQNPDCKGKRIALLQHFVSRNCMDIEGLGDAMIELLVKSGLVVSISDIFALSGQSNKQKLGSLPGVGRKKVHQIITEIEQAKDKPLWRLIHGLGLLGVGKKIAKTLAEHIKEEVSKNHEKNEISTLSGGKMLSKELIERKYETLIDILDAEELKNLFGIGERTAEAIEAYFEENEKLIKNLLEVGFFTGNGKEQDTDEYPDILSDETIVITGSFDIFRNELSNLLLQLGASVTGSVSGSTTILLAGDNPGSKVKKAEKNNVKILGLEGFIEEFPEAGEHITTLLSQKALKVTKNKEKSDQNNAPHQGGLFE